MIIFDLKLIGENIRKSRVKKGISQDEAAWQAGISLRTYADIERGAVNARIVSVLKICDVLELTPDMICVAETDEKRALAKEEMFKKLESLSEKKKCGAYLILEEYIKAVSD